MFPPEAAAAEDVPLVKRVARWLDWWCTPRWRALLTWVGLVAVIALIETLTHFDDRLSALTNWEWRHVRDLTGFREPMWTIILPIWMNVYMAMVWMEPFALRLNLPRGVAWVVLRTGSLAVITCLLWGAGLFTVTLVAALPIPALLGWRTKPWVVPIGAMLSLGLGKVVGNWKLLPGSWQSLPNNLPLETYAPCLYAITNIAFAVVLLYGTRLLSPEERAERRRVRFKPEA